MMTVIGISGKIGVGKDYVAQWLAGSLRANFPQRPVLLLAFADMLKLVCLMNDPTIEYEHVFGEKTPASRLALQNTGTEYRERVGRDVWIRLLMYTMRMHADRNHIGTFIVTDVRFREEAEALKEIDALLIRVEAPDRNWTRLLANAKGDESRAIEFSKHASEVGLDDYAGFALTIDNWVGAAPLDEAAILAALNK